MLFSPRLLLATAVFVLLGGCSDRVEPSLGEPCDLTADCASPYVCRLGVCREECRAARDCRVGLLCVTDPEGFGVCQLEDETECSLASECGTGLVCRFGTCTNECDSDRDCISGLICDVVDDGLACRDPSEEECRINSDCRAPLICARDLRCRPECRIDRDCRDGLRCDVLAAEPSCVEESMLTDGGMDGGVDAMDSSADAPDAMTVVGPTDVRFVLGRLHGCFSRMTSLFCWGGNLSGQVGTRAASTAERPEAVPIPGSVVAFGLGREHTCAQTDQLYCWGNNDFDQLGSAGPSSHIPALVAGAPSGVLGLGLGDDHSCAWTATSVHCWGNNENGQLGNGDTADTPVPTTLDLGRPPIHVVGGTRHTCALRNDGRVYCWGRSDGSFGDSGSPDRRTPGPGPFTDPATALAAGRSHTCALLTTGTVRCWGENDTGQVGNGTRGGFVTTPVDITLPATAIQIAAGETSTCALLTDGTVSCWGGNANGMLGTTARRLPPHEPSPIGTSFTSGATAVQVGVRHTCVHRMGGNGECVGLNDSSEAFGVVTPHSDHTPLMVSW